MNQHMPVAQVRSQHGKLRNARLQHVLREQGVDWQELRQRAEFDNWIEAQGEINLCVVAGFSYILPQCFIDRCSTVINFHPGLLHQCRGPQPVAAAIDAAHQDFGVSIHRIDSEAIDAGPIIIQKSIAINYQVSYAANYRSIKTLMATLADQVFAGYRDDVWPSGTAWQVREDAYLPRLPKERLLDLIMAPSLVDWQA
jgi:methionyl-tRNA formyltransferase